MFSQVSSWLPTTTIAKWKEADAQVTDRIPLEWICAFDVNMRDRFVLRLGPQGPILDNPRMQDKSSISYIVPTSARLLLTKRTSQWHHRP